MKTAICISAILGSLLTGCVNTTDSTSEKNRYFYFYDLLPLHDDTLIALDQSRMLFTSDAGIHWKESDIRPQYITIDDNGILWALDVWIRPTDSEIEDYYWIYKSEDRGVTWVGPINYDLGIYDPTKIVSSVHQPLRMLAYDRLSGNDSGHTGYTFELKADTSLKNWKFIDSIPNSNVFYSTYLDSIIKTDYKLIDQTTILKRQRSNNWDTVIRLDYHYSVQDFLFKNNTLYVAGSHLSNVFFAEVAKDTILKEYKMSGKDAHGIRSDSKGRIWVYGEYGIFLKMEDSLKLVY